MRCVLVSETTQIENPRTQWRQEQERMLKEYLVVAQEALKAKKEMYLVKQQRLELAQQEMLLFHELSEDNRSITSSKLHTNVQLSFIIKRIRGKREIKDKRCVNWTAPWQPKPDLSWPHYLARCCYIVDVPSGAGGGAAEL